ncbi:glycosyltransferase family 4 protein [Rhodohalobacter sp. SW132]|uniref:glycosyltransferase n=1 Tax=Rhodohalobacter sp. SW132 TaxID=2293433 RepID=UPI000E259BA0|nr:glycosyltransferase [Rhodohalobacter sp. SW132]REL24732.1 glycosyltransferase family 4 protein [Rhodohalobacter sp. SW132]
MKRICLVIHSLGIGGMERVMSLLANNFSERRDSEVHLVLIGKKRQISYPLSENVVVHRPEFTFNNSRRTIDTLRTMRFLRAEVKAIDPDTVLSFGEMWNNLVLLSLFGLQYPVYVSERSQPEKNLGRLHNFLRDKLYPGAAGYIAQTEQAKEICLKHGWNHNVKVIGNPVRNVKPNPEIEKENIVLTVGRLIRTKHVDHLIEIFTSIDKPGWKLLIVGGDAKKQDLSEELQKQIDELNMNNRIFLEGQQKDVDRYYNRSKIFAFTSSSEGFPNAIGEALSAGLPVVAYDCVAGPSDMIADGENGYLVPLFDKEEFKRKLTKLMDSDTLRKSFSNKSDIKIQAFGEMEIVEEFYGFIMHESSISNYS